MYEIPIKHSGNDLKDLNNIARKLNIQITAHAINRDVVHSTCDKEVKIFILLDYNHYDSIVNITGFEVAERKL